MILRIHMDDFCASVEERENPLAPRQALDRRLIAINY